MIYQTQRSKADKEVDNIKSAVKQSGLDYFVEESPFSVTLRIKKTFLQDFSPRYTEALSTSSPQLPRQVSPSPPVPIQSPCFDSEESGFLESPICASCHEKDRHLDEVRKELVKTILDSKQNTENLRIPVLLSLNLRLHFIDIFFSTSLNLRLVERSFATII